MITDEGKRSDRDCANTQGLIWLDGMRSVDRWDLSSEQVCTLLGGISIAIYFTWVEKANNGECLSLSEDIEVRLSLLLGLHKALTLSAPGGYEKEFLYSTVNHPLFKGKSVIELICEDGSIGMLKSIKAYFDSKI